MTKDYRIAVLPGDGIGKEVMPQAVTILQAAAQLEGIFSLHTDSFPWGAEHFLASGEFMPANGLDILRQYDAILFTAAGHPAVTDFRSSWEFVFVIRKQFKQYANIRPVKSYSGVPTLLTAPDAIDLVIVRENSEGEYAGPGGVVHADWDNGVALQTSVFTRAGIERIAHYAFKLARERRRKVTNITKSNAMLHSLVYWDRVIEEVSHKYPDVEYGFMLVDAASMKFVQNPAFFDVIVTTNQFGDILSDLGGAMAGSIGLCPSGNVNPEGDYPSMYEPVHGSAPDIAGKGIANPIGTILSGALMLKDLGQPQAAARIQAAVDAVLASGLKTRDLGGTASTSEMGAAIRKALHA
jgi:tartrate dehydrogenase/decarboxylase/D-malate dehydrogenase